MCGIFGFVNRTPYTSSMMPFLALEMLRRGRDSWGVTDGVNTIKKIGAIIDSWHLPAWESR
jgi:glucosamine 6-phosphate synthetase-like amidotransferase/phosphosugar isomerase protein